MLLNDVQMNLLDAVCNGICYQYIYQDGNNKYYCNNHRRTKIYIIKMLLQSIKYELDLDYLFYFYCITDNRHKKQ